MFAKVFFESQESTGAWGPACNGNKKRLFKNYSEMEMLNQSKPFRLVGTCLFVNHFDRH